MTLFYPAAFGIVGQKMTSLLHRSQGDAEDPHDEHFLLTTQSKQEQVQLSTVPKCQKHRFQLIVIGVGVKRKLRGGAKARYLCSMSFHCAVATNAQQQTCNHCSLIQMNQFCHTPESLKDVSIRLFFFFFFTLQIHPFFYVALCLKKKENMQHMISGTHTINRSHQPCVDVTPPCPHHHTRVSSTGGGCSNKERQRLQPLASIGLHTTFTGIHICYIDIPQWVLTRHLRTFFFIIFL